MPCRFRRHRDIRPQQRRETLSDTRPRLDRQTVRVASRPLDGLRHLELLRPVLIALQPPRNSASPPSTGVAPRVNVERLRPRTVLPGCCPSCGREGSRCPLSLLDCRVRGVWMGDEGLEPPTSTV
jgi:hypothetical protein